MKREAAEHAAWAEHAAERAAATARKTPEAVWHAERARTAAEAANAAAKNGDVAAAAKARQTAEEAAAAATEQWLRTR